ncbi:cytochrome P450 [Punctularia strigosozonata HHB-11173 SS5]|uniref:cytochrome P450 n=1 Tax=Punctularia strigosozonata (strain HHB-11173) TaxID=741275 RepID=UPI0004416998|nr:cytochrome P450 [Punctularia strigosozonata HHB-11173 SS5]EIN06384.1 cytochrome P450 [Punctularia strigosozonata HHB-11173 SS5]
MRAIVLGGPPTVPILGNLPIFPREFPHFRFSGLAKEYGDVFSLKIMNQTMIILNSPTAVEEIIEKRSLSSASRPASIIADMLTPDNMNFGTCHCADEQWKHMRKAATRLLNNENMNKFRPLQHAEATQLMWDFAHDPEVLWRK